MQVVKKIFLGIFVIWFAFLAFMPKTELYYLLEKELVKYDVKLNEETIKEGIFSLELNGVKLFAKGIPIANIKKIEIMTLLGYTTFRIENIVFDELLATKAPKKIENIDIVHSILDVTHITINSNGTLGAVNGNVALVQRKVRVDFPKSKEIYKIRNFLKKDKKGWYYEKTF